MSDADRKAIVSLPLDGTDAYKSRLRNLTDDERKIITDRIPVPAEQADKIIAKVLDCHTIAYEDFMIAAKQLISKNREAFKILGE